MKFMRLRIYCLLLLSCVFPALLPAEMVFVEGGTFYMTDVQTGLVHRVTVSSFEIETEEGGFLGNWWEAVYECNRMSRAKGYKPCYSINEITDEREWGQVPYEIEFGVDVGDIDFWSNIKCDFNADGYRLPTEAEWEWAARGGTKSKGYKYSGSNNLDEVAWYSGNTQIDKRYYDRGGYLIPDINGKHWQNPAQKKPNELGIYDMSGNLSEWVWDSYGECKGLVQVNPTGDRFDLSKTLKGGNWTESEVKCEINASKSGYASEESYTSYRFCRSLSTDHYDTIKLEDSDINRQILKPVMKYVPCTNAPASLNIEPYEIAETELSRELYSLIRGTELYQPEGNLPAEGIAWYEAVELCNLLSFMYGYTPCYSLRGKTNPDEWNNDDGLAWKKIKCDLSADGYRLPTEAEWQYAAESGRTSNSLSECWCRENSGGRSHAVYSRTENSLGIHNMYGNVQEWCWESVEQNKADKVLRGGDYKYSKEEIVLMERRGESPDVEGGTTGIRLCRSLGRIPKKKGIFGSIVDFIMGLF